jgi:hypothetical protein
MGTACLISVRGPSSVGEEEELVLIFQKSCDCAELMFPSEGMAEFQIAVCEIDFSESQGPTTETKHQARRVKIPPAEYRPRVSG